MRFDEIYEGLLQGKKYRLSYWKKNQYIYYNKTYSVFRNQSEAKVILTTKNLMTLDNWEEYKEDIHDKYNKYIGCLCYFYDNIAMNKNCSWYYYTGNRPFYIENGNTWIQNTPYNFTSLRCFNIDKVPNWKNSLFRFY